MKKMLLIGTTFSAVITAPLYASLVKEEGDAHNQGAPVIENVESPKIDPVPMVQEPQIEKKKKLGHGLIIEEVGSVLHGVGHKVSGVIQKVEDGAEKIVHKIEHDLSTLFKTNLGHSTLKSSGLEGVEFHVFQKLHDMVLPFLGSLKSLPEKILKNVPQEVLGTVWILNHTRQTMQGALAAHLHEFKEDLMHHFPGAHPAPLQEAQRDISEVAPDVSPPAPTEVEAKSALAALTTTILPGIQKFIMPFLQENQKKLKSLAKKDGSILSIFFNTLPDVAKHLLGFTSAFDASTIPDRKESEHVGVLNTVVHTLMDFINAINPFSKEKKEKRHHKSKKHSGPVMKEEGKPS